MKEQVGLNFKEFKTKPELVEWANSKEGTEYIISINMDYGKDVWIIWYIVE